MNRSTETDRSSAHMPEASYMSPNGIRQKSSRSGVEEILLLEEKLVFGPGSEQVKIPVDILALDDLDWLESFSITLNVKVSTNLKNLKHEQLFFQIGSSPVTKTLGIGITNDKTFFVSCVTKKQKAEVCYTQCKVKNGEYQIGVTVSNEGSFSELTVFINGKNEASLVFPSTIDTIEGDFLFGSDFSLGGFQGEISDAIFYVKVLDQNEVKDCFVSQGLKKEKSVYQIRKEKKAYLDTTEYFSKKKGLPLSLVRSHDLENHTLRKPFLDDHADEQNNQQSKHLNEHQLKEQLYTMIDDLKDFIYLEEDLYHDFKELACNFEWVFNICSVLSPVIEENGIQPKHTFNCLHSALCQVETRYYPCYAITVDQFMKVLSKINSKIKRDDIINAAERINCLDINKEFGNFIYYDKLLIALRNATLSKEEIQTQNKNTFEEIDRQVILSSNTLNEHDDKKEAKQQIITKVVAYNLIPIFEGAEYFDQKDFIEANPDAKITKIIISIDKANSHIKYVHLSYKLKDGQVKDYEIGKPLVTGLPGKDLVHFTIDINDNEFLTSVKASNFHSNNANRVLNFLSFGLNTHPDGIAYGKFTAHPTELKSIAIEPHEYETKKILGFYGAFRDDLVGLGVYVQETEIIEPEQQAKENAEKAAPKIEENDDEYVIALPLLKPDWNEGRLQIVMNRCADCFQHQGTTSHEEADYATKFNDWGNRIKDYFPNVDIIGNYDKPKVFGHFEIYVRGVGSSSDRDFEGRVFLHQNYTTPEMKTKFSQVFEKLVFWGLEYGSTMELAKVQDLFLQKNAKTIPPKWEKAHEHPVAVPERISDSKIRKAKQGKIEDGTPVVCKHWACGVRFNFDSMSETHCQHHPGRYEFGSVHGLWPEGWTCCRGAWENPGCKKGKHDLIPANRNYLLCVNHGDANPKHENPDSACGKAFQDASDECKYHQGYLVGNKNGRKWSCCGEFGENAAPCVSTTHRSAQWPEEEAKLYFFTREVRNPGVNKEFDNPNKFSKKATTSGFFRKIKPYVVYEDPLRKKARKLDATENEPRFCLNWGCGKVYKEAENKKIRNCKCHPGRWDFGYTGISVSQATTEFLRDQSDVVIWKPHWTCCRQPWTVGGCTKTFHQGELVSEAPEPKYKWPDENAQKYFRKTVSNLWKEKLGTRYQLEPKQVAQKFDDFAKVQGGKIPLSILPQFCDKLKLHLLVISEDLSPHIRFLMVVHHTAEPILDDGHGNIDKNKFLEWWFAKLDE